MLVLFTKVEAPPALRPQIARRHVPHAAGRVEFGDVSMMWYANQGEAPLAPSRGQLQDHVALGVADLDAWVAKLEGEGVVFLEEPYPLGDTRAATIEGPSREAIELVEVKSAQFPNTSEHILQE